MATTIRKSFSCHRFLHSSAIQAPLRIFESLQEHKSDNPAIFYGSNSFSFAQLAKATVDVGEELRGELKRSDLQQERVALLGPRSASYVAGYLGIWHAGGTVVPLGSSIVHSELEYKLQNCQTIALLVHESQASQIQEVAHKHNVRVVTIPKELDIPQKVDTIPNDLVPDWICSADRHAQIIYTSGTTGRPKGVVTTFGNVYTQVQDMIKAWEWTHLDRLLHLLPMNHVHGIVNTLLCPLWAGASIEIHQDTSAESLWKRLQSSVHSESNKHFYSPITLFMAVPTIYHRLLQYYSGETAEAQASLSCAADQVRLFVSGSAPLPVSIFQQWERVTGQRILERYGMTEIGMALTNPLHETRHEGYVGQPFPSVSVRIVDIDTEKEVESNESGELRIKGSSVFKEYWGNIEATSESFDNKGWFKTGDIALYNPALDSIKILGRASVDIIKSGGYKISALEIERELLEHPCISECVVFGVEDNEWGQRVAAVICPKVDADETKLEFQVLRKWAKQRMAAYKVPSLLKIVSAIPRNALGKVNKKELKASITWEK